MSFIPSLLRAADINPSGLAINHGENRKTWAQFISRISKIASNLKKLGANKGDRIAFMCLNSASYLELLLASWWLGIILVPINTRLSWNEIKHILDDSKPTLFIADECFHSEIARAEQECPDTKKCLLLTNDAWAELESGMEINPENVPLDSVGGIFYTGGTTGKAKGVTLTHQSFLFTAMNQERELRIGKGSVYLHVAPLFHLAGFSTALGAILASSAHTFIDQFSPENFFERLNEDDVTHVLLIPSMIQIIMDHPGLNESLLRRLITISYGASPITPNLLKRLIQTLPTVRLVQFYGMTEVCGASTVLKPEQHVISGPQSGKTGSVGQPLETFEIKIIKPNGEECGISEAGEIIMKGPAVMSGYWEDQDRTEKTIIEGWLYSGDVGYKDKDGFIYVVDRLKDMIISGGENIYSVEVENVITSHPDILTCAIIGVPDQKWGEKVHGFVVTKPNSHLTEEAIKEFCRSSLARYKCPQTIDFVDSLPLSGVGKILKSELRKKVIIS